MNQFCEVIGFPSGQDAAIFLSFQESHIIIPLLTKFVRSRWLDIGLVLICDFVNFGSVFDL